MRFFEVPIAGGLQLSSACPEMENVFRHGEHLFYFRDADDLTKLIRELLADDKRRLEVTQKAQQLAQASHTYKARAQQILDLLGEAQESCAVH
jgi:spore maturation protein CgeB